MKNKFLIAMLGSVLLVPACGDDGDRRVASRPAEGTVEAGGVVIPEQLLGLQVQAEDVQKLLGDTERPFVESMGLFSLRENDLVRATLQVSKFNRLARPSNPNFRGAIINRLGTTRPLQTKVDDITVYLTLGTDQTLFAWFKDRGFYVLTTHQEYEFPRTLLRRAMSLEQDF